MEGEEEEEESRRRRRCIYLPSLAITAYPWLYKCCYKQFQIKNGTPDTVIGY